LIVVKKQEKPEGGRFDTFRELADAKGYSYSPGYGSVISFHSTN
jgi:hypothetical protein